jgi:2-keto-4-pentenoate hydratase/2-oxohepta-3-ene-1,7-dioic acid hydratase in catechol pathway
MRTVRFRGPSGVVRTGDWTDSGIEFGGETYDAAEVDVLPPTEPTKILGVGANFPSFVSESDTYDWPTDAANHPRYVKTPDSLVGHGGTVVLDDEGEFVHELELGVVIGRQCRNVSRADADSVIAGYTCVDDVTNRAGGDWVRIKNFDTSAPVGPVVAAPSVVPQDATMELRVNGEQRQRDNRRT